MFKGLALAAALFGFATQLPSYGATPSVTAVQPAIVAQASLPPLFDSENAAQAHCPKDVVVELTRFRGVFPLCGEGSDDGQKASLSPGVPG
jgi:hypothetical protein